MSRATKTALIFAAAFFLNGSIAVAAEYNWRMYGILPTTHAYSKAMIASFKRIENKSDGRLKIDFHYFAETPYKVGDALRILRDGLVDMAEWLPSYTAGTYPVLSAPELPFLSPGLNDAESAQIAANKAWSTPVVKEVLDGVLAEHRSMALARYYFEPMNFWFTQPVTSIGDIQDKKIRVFTPELADLVAALGASPVTVATTEQYTSLQRNVLDGTITGSGNLSGAKLIEVLKGGYITNFMMTSARILVSKTKFDRLPPDLQTILQAEIAQLETELLESMPRRDAKNQTDAMAAGMKIVLASDDDYARVRKLAMDAVWGKWKQRAGAKGEQALDEVIASQTPDK